MGWLGLTAVSATNRTTNGTTVPDLSVALIADGFTQPTDIANAGDDRLFIVERAGLIKIIDIDHNTVITPFLNIAPRVDSTSHSERGLLGLAFHPNYPETPYFFVNYINNSGNTVISRFTVTSDPYLADEASEEIVLTINQPFRNHNGGDLNFGPDGYLYIATGDGGSGDDPLNQGQQANTLLGKILRIDIDHVLPYTVPSNNPYTTDDTKSDEIWALGLRNPWRFSFDRQTGDLYIGDVGQGAFEEINFAPFTSKGGENYGWRCYEGNQLYISSGCDQPSSYVFPIDDYPHNNPNDNADQGSSVTGGFVYRGQTYKDLQGYYLYGDFGTGNVWLAKQETDSWTIIPNGPIPDLGNISTFGEGCNGELFVADYSGEIFHIQTGFTQLQTITGANSIYLPLLYTNGEPSLACS
jgi:glucose/arabinose dehydrogenase